MFCVLVYRQIEQLRRCEVIKENEVKNLCAKAREILIEESNVQRIDPPVTVSHTHTHTHACVHIHIYIHTHIHRNNLP